MASIEQPSHAEHQPIPITGEEDYFSDDGDDISYEAKQPVARYIFIGIAIGITIGVGTGVLVGASIWSQGQVPGQDAPPEPPTPPRIDSSSWLVDNLPKHFMLKSENNAKEKCESQGINRVWATNGDDGTEGKCLGRCGAGNQQGADEDNRGSGSTHHDGCGHHIHCCHMQSSLIVSPDGIDSCLCWKATLIPVEEEEDWDLNR